jgi:hypothetical protein
MELLTSFPRTGKMKTAVNNSVAETTDYANDRTVPAPTLADTAEQSPETRTITITNSSRLTPVATLHHKSERYITARQQLTQPRFLGLQWPVLFSSTWRAILRSLGKQTLQVAPLSRVFIIGCAATLPSWFYQESHNTRRFSLSLNRAETASCSA